MLYWFRAKGPAEHAAFAPERFPVFIWQPSDADGFYGFPAIGGLEEGVKIATEGHDVVDPDTHLDEVERHQAALLAASACAAFEAGGRPSTPEMNRPASASFPRSTPVRMPSPSSM